MPKRKRHRQHNSASSPPAPAPSGSGSSVGHAPAGPPPPKPSQRPMPRGQSSKPQGAPAESRLPAGQTDTFINPYTFVSFPTEPLRRSEPAGHASLVGTGVETTDLSDDITDSGPSVSSDERFMGRLDIVATARTRVMVRDGSEAGNLPRRADMPIIPGSSVHGALRSMHETLVGGCLRVFDTEFVPAYRDEATSKINRGFKLAVVEQVVTDGPDAGRPEKLTLCSEFAFVKSEVLDHATPGESGRLSTGTRWDTSDRAEGIPTRPVFPRHTQFTPNDYGDWVAMLTDGRARQKAPGKSDYIPYYVTLGKIAGGQEINGVTDSAWSSYQAATRGSRDYTEDVRGMKEDELRAIEVAATAGRRAPSVRSWETKVGDHVLPRVVHTADSEQSPAYRKIGYRPPHRPWLFPGQPVWVVVNNRNEVTSIKLSIIWRHAGVGDAASRVPPSLLACTDPKHLCPSCALFGAADTNDKGDDEKARQSSYRGHVRVGDWTPIRQPSTERLQLTPMGTPRMGSGQFYLRTPTGAPLPANNASHSLREWGGDGGPKDNRQLRGRKAYWRTNDRSGIPRWKRRSHQQDAKMASSAEAFSAGTEFAGSIWFEGLTRAQIGELIACLDPAQVLPHEPADELMFTVGGGKPFGFGACSVAVTIGELHSAQSRWLGAELPRVSIEAAVAAFKATSPVGAGAWPELARVVTLDSVDTNYVWYPPGAAWSHVGSEEFDKGYEFWKESVGRQQSQGPDKKLVQLPDVLSDQKLTIIKGKPGS